MTPQVAAISASVKSDSPVVTAWVEQTCPRTGAIVYVREDARAVVTDQAQLVHLSDMLDHGLTSSPGPGWEWDAAQWRWVRWAPWSVRCQPSAGQPAGFDLGAPGSPHAPGSPSDAFAEIETSPLEAAIDLASVQEAEEYIRSVVDSRALAGGETHQDGPGSELLLREWDPSLWRPQNAVERASGVFGELVWELAAAQRAWLAAQQGGYFKQGSGILSSRFAYDFEQSLTRGKLRNCLEGRWIVFQCDQGHKTVQWTGCTRLDCEHCKEQVGVQRASRAWNDAGGLAEKWGVCVLTVPPAMRSAVKLSMRSKLRRAAWETTEEWLRGEGNEGDTGGMVWFHPVGSVYVCPRAEHARKMEKELDALDPCRTVRVKSEGEGEHQKTCSHCAQKLVGIDDEDAHPHWNVLVPLVQQHEDGTASTMEHWYPHQSNAMKRLRKLWGMRLALELGLPEPSVVNVYWNYRQGPKHIRHALRYNARSFPGWSRWITTAGGNRYGTLANKRIAALKHAISSSIGLCEKPVNVHVCHCGEESRCQGVTGAMAYRYIANGVIPPDTPHKKAKVEERWIQ